MPSHLVSSSFASARPPFPYAVLCLFFPSIFQSPFFPAGRLLCLGSSGLPATSVLATLPCPWAIVVDHSFVCVLQLLLKIKNSPFHPLYCFLVGCPCHSLGFYVLVGYLSSAPLQRLAMLSGFSHFFFPKENK